MIKKKVGNEEIEINVQKIDPKSLGEKNTGDYGQMGFGIILPEIPVSIPDKIDAITTGSNTLRKYNQDPAAECNALRS